MDGYLINMKKPKWLWQAADSTGKKEAEQTQRNIKMDLPNGIPRKKEK